MADRYHTDQPTPPAVHCSHRELVDALHELITQLRGIAELWTQHPPADPAPQDGRTYPANGLRLERRDTPEHRNIGYRRMGFAPVVLEEPHPAADTGQIEMGDTCQ